MTKVSVIIPNWNGAHLLKDCLTSLQKQTFKDFELIIVDNGSKDDSLNIIKNIYPKADVIKLEKNIGFSPAVNLGIEKAKGDFIFMLNNDTKVESKALEILVTTAKKHPEVGMVTGKLLDF